MLVIKLHKQYSIKEIIWLYIFESKEVILYELKYF
jgi:hypothetical protein